MREDILDLLQMQGPHTVDELADVLVADRPLMCETLIDLIAESRVYLESDFGLWYAESVDG